jgi:hypothetical protein
MRKSLAKQEGERKKFRATFTKLGKKVNFKGYSEDTILLTNVVDAETNERVTDHIWFSFTKGFEKIQLREGVIIEFEARVKAYKKGYVNAQLGMRKRSVDFKLSHPTQIKACT